MGRRDNLKSGLNPVGSKFVFYASQPWVRHARHANKDDYRNRMRSVNLSAILNTREKIYKLSFK